jgi:hypothetical protein
MEIKEIIERCVYFTESSVKTPFNYREIPN